MLESSRRASWAEGTLRLHGKWNSRGESFSELPISGGQMQAMPFPFCGHFVHFSFSKDWFG